MDPQQHTEIKPKARLSLEIEDLDTGDGMKTRLEFFDDAPDTIKRTISEATAKMITTMGYLGKSKEHT